MEIKQVAVVGGGTMGNGIAHVFAQNGYDTLLVETKQEFLDRATANIKKNLERQVKKLSAHHPEPVQTQHLGIPLFLRSLRKSFQERFSTQVFTSDILSFKFH